MRESLKHTAVLLLAVLYCFAMGPSGNSTVSGEIPYETSSAGTDSVSKIPAMLSHHIVQPAQGDHWVKAGQPRFLKASFIVLPEFAPVINQGDLKLSALYIRESKNLSLFNREDIIYPFHSFW